MGKTKVESRTQRKVKHARRTSRTPEQLYALATEALEQSNELEALAHAEALLQAVDPAFASNKSPTPSLEALPALNLLGEVHIGLGNEDEARQFFTLATACDPDGSIPEDRGGGAEKFMWLAQLSPEGGFDSVQWFEKGVGSLKVQIGALEQHPPSEQRESSLEEKASRLANALCSVAEIYMTDLSWEDDAEERCEHLITEAMVYAPEDPSVLQTLASIRLSQVRIDEARSALTRSMALWKDLDPDDEAVPDFATRVSLARLLMEAEMEDTAMIVLERLSLEDDQSVEACYLGGWCLHLMAEKREAALASGPPNVTDMEYLSLRRASGKWLRNTLALYKQQQYEDENLREHVEELLEGMPAESDQQDDSKETDEVEEWIDEDDSEDEEMAGA